MTQFLTEPIPTGKRALHIKAIIGAFIEFEIEAELNDEKRMVEQKGPQLFGIDQPFFDAQEKGFDVGGQRMAMRATTG